MKKTILLLLLVSPLSILPQEMTEVSQQNELAVYLSAGAHIGFWSKDGQNGVPFNMQMDLQFAKRLVLGVGYTYDSYQGNPMFFSVRTRPGPLRQNINIRFYNYLSDPEKIFSTYIGGSGGLSIWQSRFSDNNVYPSLQFLFGIKLKITKYIFWQTEFGVGPPYFCQSSVGIKL